MISIVHNAPTLPSRYVGTSTCDVEPSGALVIYDHAGEHVLAAFAPGVWAAFEILKEE